MLARLNRKFFYESNGIKTSFLTKFSDSEVFVYGKLIVLLGNVHKVLWAVMGEKEVRKMQRIAFKGGKGEGIF